MDNSFTDRSRFRSIVSLAATKVEDPNTQEWIRTDREGSWEKTAQALLERTAEEAAKKNLTVAEVDDAIAGQLVYMALTAQITSQKKRRAR